MNNIIFFPVQDKVKVKADKSLALNESYVQSAKKCYENDATIVAANTAVSNKDLLSQSFGGTQEQPGINMKAQETPVQLTNIGIVQNAESIEKNPVNMSMDTVPVETNVNNEQANTQQEVVGTTGMDTTMDPLSGLENLIPNTGLNITPLEETSVDNSETKEELPQATNDIGIPQIAQAATTQTETTAPVLESPYQVSSAPNIFDQLIPSPMEMSTNNTENKVEDTAPVTEETNNNLTSPIVEQEDKQKEENAVSDDILLAEITLEKECSELYFKLAENRRKKADLLESKRKTSGKVIELNPTNNEPSAAELFNSNGTLNDNKVLELDTGIGLNKAA